MRLPLSILVTAAVLHIAQAGGQTPSVLAPLAPEAVPPPVPLGAEEAVPTWQRDNETMSAVPLPPPSAAPPGTDSPGPPISLATSSSAAEVKPTGTIRTALPSPDLPPDAPPEDFLRAAQAALAAGRAGETRQSLEMAATRLLTRTVDAGKERDPSDDLAVKQITEALNALNANDRVTCSRYIEFAIQTAMGRPQ